MHTSRKSKQKNRVYTDQTVPIFLWVGIKPTFLGTRLTGTSRRTAQTRIGTPLLQAGGDIRCPKGSREFPCRVHQVLGLPVPFPASA
jgi:hypothetical protein